VEYEGKPKKFTFRGYTLEQLQQMDLEEFAKLCPARIRRSILRLIKKINTDQKARKLIIKIAQAWQAMKEGKPFKKKIKTHYRSMPILPQMVGMTIYVHNGKEFVPVEIKPEMLGHRLGEFVPTRKKVAHGGFGQGASRSTRHVGK
jgi:small subunit ribosomal protein S19